MNLGVTLNMVYWDNECPFRRRNFLVAATELENLQNFLKDNDIEVKCNIYQDIPIYSSKNCLKLSTSSKFFDKARRVNEAIFDKINNNLSVVGVFDSDVFFRKEDYNIILTHITEALNSEEAGTLHPTFTYNLLDLSEKDTELVVNPDHTVNIENLEKSKSRLSPRHSWGSGTLGGAYFTSLKCLRKVGGFDERYRTWGASDDNGLTRVKECTGWKPYISFEIGAIHLYHPIDKTTPTHYLPMFSEEYFKVNDVRENHL